MPFRPVFLWTDLLVFVLVAAIIAFACYVNRHEHLLVPWKKVARSRYGMCSLVVLSVFIVIGLLDSLHYRPRLEARQADGKANYCEYITRPGDVSAAGNARQGAPLRRSFLTTFEEVIGKHHLVHRGWEGKSEARHLKRSDRDSPVAYAKNRQLPQGLIEVGVSEERTSLFFRA